jgi:hypothetical protein
MPGHCTSGGAVVWRCLTLVQRGSRGTPSSIEFYVDCADALFKALVD